MSEIRKAKLRIADVKGIVNHIASTYKEFYRAAMEYIDNSVDAAYDEIETGVEKQFWVNVVIDYESKKLIFIDNCKGMTPEELCGLVENIGLSKKKGCPWLNGQFGFGVHAARAFAKKIKFYSKTSSRAGASIEIDRDVDENTDISCETTDYLDNRGMEHGTVVEISNFNKKVFNKTIYAKLADEIRKHFEDILRDEKIKITIIERKDGKDISYPIKPFDYESLAGNILRKEIPIETDGKKVVKVELKIADKPQKDRLVTIQNKGRRISDLVEMKSFIQFYKNNEKNINIWKNPYLVGRIEVNGACSPNITRDDFEPGEIRDEIYLKLSELDSEIKKLIEDKAKSQNQEAYNKLGNIMSDYLNDYLRKFRFEFYKPEPKLDEKEIEENPEINIADETAKQLDIKGVSSIGLAGTPVGENRNSSSSGHGEEERKDNDENIPIVKEPGTDAVGKGDETGELPSVKSKGKEKIEPKKTSGPRIKFRDIGADADRSVGAGDTIEINTLHPDFIKRNAEKNGEIILSPRLLNYVSIIIAPIIIQNVYEKQGQMPLSAKEVGDRSTIFIMGFEDYLMKSANEMVLEI